VKIFLYEYTCSGGFSSDPHALPLCNEGWAMLSALAKDFGRIPGVETITLLDQNCPRQLSGSIRRLSPEEQEQIVFQNLASAADYTLIVAPEFDDLLHTRYRWAQDAGGRVLGSSPEALRLAGDKLALGALLRSQGIPTPESVLFDDHVPAGGLKFPLVLKPRQGAGSQVTYLVGQGDHLSRSIRDARSEGWRGEFLLQPFVPGLAASVALLVGPNACSPLLPGAQHISDDGRFRYQGGSLPLPSPLAERALQLSEKAVNCVPGLKGWVGVDLVLGEAQDGTQDFVMEINARVTTSYIGLRELAENNLDEALLQVVLEDRLPDLRWKAGMIRFSADGCIFFTPPGG